VLGIRRRTTKSHRQLAKDELSESFDHLMQAATHLAGGVGKSVGPRVNTAREYMSPATGKMRNSATQGWEATIAALAPLAEAARDGARQAGGTARKAKAKNLKAIRKKENRMSRKRWPMLAGLLAAGTAVGAAGALVMRRRKRQQWEEYDPSRPMASSTDSTKSAVSRAADTVSTGAHTAATKVATTAQSMADKTSSAAESAKARVTSTQSDTTPTADLGRTSTTSYNSRT
jgi:hypothetical protein